ncbi:hypothetical protein [Fusibacter sp. JL216-2]|uniref:hypothetical protein n=1 Tax=Fusibacter sp. JL216-2 TaxID=3071453 RepID=UPI003D33FE45
MRKSKKANQTNISINSQDVKQENSGGTNYAKDSRGIDQVTTTQKSNLASVLIILAGIVMTFLGYSGSINWSLSFGGVESNLANASPGVLIVIVGFIMFVKE